MRKFKEYRFVVGETHQDINERKIVDASVEVCVIADTLDKAVRKAFTDTGYNEVLRIVEPPREVSELDVEIER